jgi:hypothetical protein
LSPANEYIYVEIWSECVITNHRISASKLSTTNAIVSLRTSHTCWERERSMRCENTHSVQSSWIFADFVVIDSIICSKYCNLLIRVITVSKLKIPSSTDYRNRTSEEGGKSKLH